MEKTPVTKFGRRRYDHLDPCEAARLAWRNAGNHPHHHVMMKAQVRNAMPLLARALDRMAKDEE